AEYLHKWQKAGWAGTLAKRKADKFRAEKKRGTLVLKHFDRSETSFYTVLYCVYLGPCQDNHAWIRLEPFTM
ncbi:MAG: hypothetical protein U9N58_04235, partial [Thermodesulfobacteriota bacterium]|nr:hypothetical protein [Thermodesulfobacteriota bacterium]